MSHSDFGNASDDVKRLLKKLSDRKDNQGPLNKQVTNDRVFRSMSIIEVTEELLRQVACKRRR